MPETKYLIDIEVKNKIATAPLDAFIVCGNTDYKIQFTFDSEWDAYTLKTAIFHYNGAEEEKVFSGNVCEVPELVNTPLVAIGVYAGDIHTSTPAEVRCKRSARCLGGGSHPPPSPDVYLQILEMLEEIEIEKGKPTDSPPLMDGEQAVGESLEYSRADHRHPTDTTRAKAEDLRAEITRATEADTSLARATADNAQAIAAEVGARQAESEHLMSEVGRANTAASEALRLAENLDDIAGSALAIANTALAGSQKAVEDAEEANAIAKGSNLAEGFNDYEALIEAVNAAPRDKYRVGQSFYIGTLDVPDLWVKTIDFTSTPYTYTDDASLVAELKANSTIRVGHYTLSMLETLKQDLTNYVQFNNYAGTYKAGVSIIKPGDHGLYMQNGEARIYRAKNAEIDAKEDEFKPITPKYVDYAVKKSLADSKLQGEAENAWTAEEKTAVRNLLDAVGVNDVATPAMGAQEAKAGLFKVTNTNYGLNINPSNLHPMIQAASEGQITMRHEWANNWQPIVPATLDHAVKCALTGNDRTLTEEEQTKANDWLGSATKLELEYETLRSEALDAEISSYIPDRAFKKEVSEGTRYEYPAGETLGTGALTFRRLVCDLISRGNVDKWQVRHTLYENDNPAIYEGSIVSGSASLIDKVENEYGISFKTEAFGELGFEDGLPVVIVYDHTRYIYNRDGIYATFDHNGIYLSEATSEGQDGDVTREFKLVLTALECTEAHTEIKMVDNALIDLEKHPDFAKKQDKFVNNTGATLAVPVVNKDTQVATMLAATPGVAPGTIPLRDPDGRIRTYPTGQETFDEKDVAISIREAESLIKTLIGPFGYIQSRGIPQGGADGKIGREEFGLFLVSGEDVTVHYTNDGSSNNAGHTSKMHLFVKTKSDDGATNWLFHYYVNNTIVISNLVKSRNIVCESDITVHNGSSQYSCKIVAMPMRSPL